MHYFLQFKATIQRYSHYYLMNLKYIYLNLINSKVYVFFILALISLLVLYKILIRYKKRKKLKICILAENYEINFNNNTYVLIESGSLLAEFREKNWTFLHVIGSGVYTVKPSNDLKKFFGSFNKLLIATKDKKLINLFNTSINCHRSFLKDFQMRGFPNKQMYTTFVKNDILKIKELFYRNKKICIKLPIIKICRKTNKYKQMLHVELYVNKKDVLERIEIFRKDIKQLTSDIKTYIQILDSNGKEIIFGVNEKFHVLKLADKEIKTVSNRKNFIAKGKVRISKDSLEIEILKNGEIKIYDENGKKVIKITNKPLTKKFFEMIRKNRNYISKNMEVLEFTEIKEILYFIDKLLKKTNYR